MYFSRIVFAAKILFIVVIVSSFDVFGVFGQQIPSWWQHLLDNKLYACMMVFFVGNMLEGQVIIKYYLQQYKSVDLKYCYRDK